MPVSSFLNSPDCIVSKDTFPLLLGIEPIFESSSKHCGYDFNDLTILRIEQGTRFVPDYEVVAIADFFKVSLEYLVGRTEKR